MRLNKLNYLKEFWLLLTRKNYKHAFDYSRYAFNEGKQRLKKL